MSGEDTPQSILEGDWHRELEAEAGRRTDTLRRAAHFTSLVEALRALGHGADSGCSIEDCVGCAALKAAEEAVV